MDEFLLNNAIDLQLLHPVQEMFGVPKPD